MSERTDADKLARKLLEEPGADPDDDFRMLARQLLRRKELIGRMEKQIIANLDSTGDLVNANRDIILEKHQEAVRRVRRLLTRVPLTTAHMVTAVLVLDALGEFHPMHGESWAGWPEGS
jgi:hypothetical protein